MLRIAYLGLLFQKSGYDVYVAKTKWDASKTRVHINKLIVPATRPQKATLAEELFRVSSSLKALKNELPQYFKCVIRLGVNWVTAQSVNLAVGYFIHMYNVC